MARYGYNGFSSRGLFLYRTLEKRQGLKIGCPEEVAWRVGLIDDAKLYSLSLDLAQSGYGKYLQNTILK